MSTSPLASPVGVQDAVADPPPSYICTTDGLTRVLRRTTGTVDGFHCEVPSQTRPWNAALGGVVEVSASVRPSRVVAPPEAGATHPDAKSALLVLVSTYPVAPPTGVKPPPGVTSRTNGLCLTRAALACTLVPTVPSWPRVTVPVVAPAV
jgi:hypothetical protein